MGRPTLSRPSTWKADRVREPLLVATFVELTDVLVDDFDVIDLLTHLADRCLEVLDVSAAGILLANAKGELSVAASSSEAIRTLELLEIQASEGPCYECFSTGDAIARTRRWRAAITAGRSSLPARSPPGTSL